MKPDWSDYYMGIAYAVAKRGDCLRRKCGALLIWDNQIISTGYNGTPRGVRNCTEGGCARCASDAPSGQGHETCLCVHAEANAIALAARHGERTEGTTLYATLQPCFACLKLAIQAGIERITFNEVYVYGMTTEMLTPSEYARIRALPEVQDYAALARQSGIEFTQMPFQKVS